MLHEEGHEGVQGQDGGGEEEEKISEEKERKGDAEYFKYKVLWVRYVQLLKVTVRVFFYMTLFEWRPPCKDGKVRFTSVPLKALTDQV